MSQLKKYSMMALVTAIAYVFVNLMVIAGG